MIVMSMTSKITSRGRTTPLKEIRDKLGVQPGDTLVYEAEGNAVRVRKAEPFDIAWKKGAPLTVDEMVGDFRAQCEQFGLGEHWAVLYDSQKIFGMTERLLHSLCGDAVLLINLCGALKDDELLRRIQRRAYFDLDPGFTQIWAHEWDMDLSKHNLFFTVGLNVGQSDFGIPLRGIEWQTFTPPVALEYWPTQTDTNAKNFTR